MIIQKAQLKNILKGLKRYSWLVTLILTSLILFFDFFQLCSQQSSTEQDEFNVTSLKYRPTIELVNNLGFTGLHFMIDTAWINEYKLSEGLKHKADMSDIRVFTSVQFKPLLKNSSSEHPAIILASAVTDTVTYEKVLINDLFNFKAKNPPEIKFDEKPLYMKPNEISLLEEEEIDWRMQKEGDFNFYLHFIIIYANEAENYFYSYYVVRISTPDEFILPEPALALLLKGKRKYIKMDPKNIRVEEISFYSHSFNLEECEKLDEFFNFTDRIKEFRNSYKDKMLNN